MGVVREDYSADGDAWDYTTHDQARSKTWHWGEDGIGGLSDEHQFLCFASAFWNGRDPIIKERFFGLTNEQGNHGEDVKELYYYLDNMPDHRYMRMLYKYPQEAFPYAVLVEENQQQSRQRVRSQSSNGLDWLDLSLTTAILAFTDIFPHFTERIPFHTSFGCIFRVSDKHLIL